MTALAKRITKTPMAPYLSLIQGMSPEEKQILILYLTESLAEVNPFPLESNLSKEERKRGLMSLAGCWNDNPEDAARMEAAIKEGRKNEYMLDVNLDD